MSLLMGKDLLGLMWREGLIQPGLAGQAVPGSLPLHPLNPQGLRWLGPAVMRTSAQKKMNYRWVN